MRFKLETIEDTQNPQVKKRMANLERLKKEAIAKGEEELANNYWRKTEVLKLNILYISAFYKIKKKEYRDAWVELEQCEIMCDFIGVNSIHDFMVRSRAEFIKDKVAKWQSLYPYSVFLSPEFVVGYHTCSICGHKIRPRCRCNHKKGKVYNGELCVHIASDIDNRSVSLVANPVQKYSVVHNDETLDFSIISYASDLLESPFEEWDVNWTRKIFPRDMFSKVDIDSECPCKSGNSFGDCCNSKAEVEIPHVDFLLYRGIPKEKAVTRFPY